MGASGFQNSKSAKTAKEAFNELREQALYHHGHDGYSGSIGEKHSFVMRTLRVNADVHDQVDGYLDDGGPISEKDGPAGCFDMGPDPKVPGNRIWMFFGWARS